MAYILVIGGIELINNVSRRAYNILVVIVRWPNIWFRGWPPEHLDADGDHKK